jgi:hypothetical protein
MLLTGRLRSMLTAEETRSTTNVRLSLARQLAETLLHSISDSKYKVLFPILKMPMVCMVLRSSLASKRIKILQFFFSADIGLSPLLVQKYNGATARLG